MKKNLRVLALLLTLMLVFAAGCTSETNSPASNNTSAAPAQTSAAAPTDNNSAPDEPGEAAAARIVDYTGMSATEMVEANRAANWMISEELVTLRVMINNTPDHPADMNSQHLFQLAEERTNVHVDWVMPGSSAFGEQRALALASGDMPDVILNGLSNSQLAKYGADGTLAAYDLLMEQYPDAAPNITRMFEQYPDTKVYSTAPDGHIYSMPRINEGPWMKQDGNLIINQQWLDNLGLAMPTTIDEYKDVLMAFKNDDPNGNGQADEIPYLVNLNSNFQSWPGLNHLMGSFHAFPANDYRTLHNGELVNTATTEGWKQGMHYLHDLYANGLMDPESFTVDGSQYVAKLAVDPPIIGSAQVWDINDQVSIDNKTEVYSYVPPLKGPNGQDPWVYRFYKAGWDRSGCVIWNDTPIPEIALMWVDYIYDPINSLEMIEGEFYVRLEYQENEGFFIIGDPPSGMSQGQYRYANSPGHSGSWAIFEPEYMNVLRLTFTDAKVNYNAEYCAPYYVDPFPPVFFTEDESETMTTLNTDIINEITRQSCEWIMNGGIDEGWDAYLSKLDAIGLEQWMKINNDAYARFK